MAYQRDMAKIKIESKKINNGLKAIIKRLSPDDPSKRCHRVDYAQAVVDYLSHPENGSYQISRNNVYLLVNDYVNITPGNIHIAKAIKTVVEQFEQELAELDLQ